MRKGFFDMENDIRSDMESGIRSDMESGMERRSMGHGEWTATSGLK